MKRDLLVAVLGVAILATVASLRAQQAPPGGGRAGAIPGNSGAEPCANSPICAWGRERNNISHELRTPDLGFTFAYPFALPEGGGGVSAVAINSKEHLFAFQRNAAGKPQLFEFDQNHKLVRTIGEDVIGHQNKAHGMAIDAEDNIWICDENGDTVMKLSPEGKAADDDRRSGDSAAIGTRRRDSAALAAAARRVRCRTATSISARAMRTRAPTTPTSPRPTAAAPRASCTSTRTASSSTNGSATTPGQGHFSMVHGIAINPDNGNVYIGDREEYRLVVYDAQRQVHQDDSDAKPHLCALYVDPHKQLWLATGQDGQIFKIDWDGNVLGAIGNGPGRGEGQFIESSYMAMDAQGNLYTGDTSVGRITKMVPSKRGTRDLPR